jgi:hypothetical protein
VARRCAGPSGARPAGPIAPYRPGIADAALRNAQAAVPGMRVQFVAFPGAAFSSRDHLAVYLRAQRR